MRSFRRRAQRTVKKNGGEISEMVQKASTEIEKAYSCQA